MNLEDIKKQIIELIIKKFNKCINVNEDDKTIKSKDLEIYFSKNDENTKFKILLNKDYISCLMDDGNQKCYFKLSLVDDCININLLDITCDKELLNDIYNKKYCEKHIEKNVKGISFNKSYSNSKEEYERFNFLKKENETFISGFIKLESDSKIMHFQFKEDSNGYLIDCSLDFDSLNGREKNHGKYVFRTNSYLTLNYISTKGLRGNNLIGYLYNVDKEFYQKIIDKKMTRSDLIDLIKIIIPIINHDQLKRNKKMYSYELADEFQKNIFGDKEKDNLLCDLNTKLEMLEKENLTKADGQKNRTLVKLLS